MQLNPLQVALPLTLLAASCTGPRYELRDASAAHSRSGRVTPIATRDEGPGGEPVDVGPDEATKLAKKTQNPVSDLISLPLQNNINTGIGPEDRTQWVLNVQPVVPFQLSDDWNLITRTILPVIRQPVGQDDVEFGLGDTTMTVFASPRGSKGVVWGVGPVLLLPTSTDSTLGAGEWGGGASAVALVMTGPWVVGGITNNVWSFESGDVNQFLVQPFVNYNLPNGWALASAPIITANWEAQSDDRWTLPVGAGVSKTLFAGKQPLQLNLQAYRNVVHPDGAAEWQVRIQLAFLFPK